MISMNLKNLRKMLKLSQEEVALRIGVSRQAVAKWEKGEAVPDIIHCIELSKLYRVSIDELINSPEKESGVTGENRGKHIFGLVKVGDRGQIVIPKKARDIFRIRPGDTILVLGDEFQQGLALIKHDEYLHFMEAVYHAKEDNEE